MVAGIKKVTGAQMLITTLDAGVDAVSIDLCDHRRARDVLIVKNDGSVERLHSALNREEEEVLDAELHRRVRRIEDPDRLAIASLGFYSHFCQPIGPITPIGPIHRFYSYLSAANGSTFVARRAGITLAINATVVSKTAITAKVQGSLGFTPNNMLVKLSKYFVST